MVWRWQQGSAFADAYDTMVFFAAICLFCIVYVEAEVDVDNRQHRQSVLQYAYDAEGVRNTGFCLDNIVCGADRA